MKTIAQQLNVTDFPFIIKDKRGNQLYYEDSYGYWYKTKFDEYGNETYYDDSDKRWIKREHDKDGNQTYCENSSGFIKDERTKQLCNKVIKIDGIKYKLTKL